MEKLTEQQWQGMFAAYWGSNCQYRFIFQDKIKYELQREVNYLCLKRMKGDSLYSDFKLLLTPLSAITNEDAIEVAKILSKDRFNTNPSYIPVIERKQDRIYIWTGGYGVCVIMHTREINWGIVPDKITASISSLLEAYDYLRSKGYDCGYLHIPSLIAAGYAVDKSKTI